MEEQGGLPAARMSARGTRQLATVVTSVSLSVPKGIQVSQMREASVLVASPMVTYGAISLCIKLAGFILQSILS